jgi:alpha-ribazole phosphatase
VRHGETQYNVQRRYTGQSDVPLSLLGERQATLLGEYLAGEDLDVIVSSDLQRTRATAQAIARQHTLPVYEDADLREIAMGAWEGHTFAEVVAADPELVVRWRSDPSLYAPPGGETLPRMRDRIVRARKHWQGRYPEGTVLWVAHGGLIGVLLCYLLDINLNRRWQFHHDNASISEFYLDGDLASITRLNEVAHLRVREDIRSKVDSGATP